MFQPNAPKLPRQNVLKVAGESIHHALVFLAGPIIAIVSVERTLQANHIKNPGLSGSAGQTIALFTGVTSMLLTFWELAGWWKKDRAQKRKKQKDFRQKSQQELPGGPQETSAEGVEVGDPEDRTRTLII